jgi:hypothetical protein
VLTKKGKHGLKAMVHLAGLEPGELAQVANIAESNSISKKFLDHILSDLRRAGLVSILRRGKGEDMLSLAPQTRYAWARSYAPSMVLSRRFHALRLPYFALATTAAISSLAPFV